MNNCAKEDECGGRREFLVKAGAVAGGLLLSFSGASAAKAADDAETEAVVKIGADSPLAKVGGTATIDTKAGKIIVRRTGEMSFKALSAICPHKNGPIKYDEATKQYFCPLHNSRFDGDGKVVKGPAKTDLQNYKTEEAAVISLKIA